MRAVIYVREAHGTMGEKTHLVKLCSHKRLAEVLDAAHEDSLWILLPDFCHLVAGSKLGAPCDSSFDLRSLVACSLARPDTTYMGEDALKLVVDNLSVLRSPG